MRQHDDLRAEAEKAIGATVKEFRTESVVQAVLVLDERSFSVTAPPGTPAEEMLTSLIRVVKSGL